MTTTTATPSRRARSAPADPLDAIFSPKSIAVCGVTASPGTVPFDIFYNILISGFKGTLYPIAPGKRSICAVRAYRYVIDIEDDVDAAVIVFPSDVVARSLEQCAQKGIKAVTIISAGFREVGPAGVEREQQLKDMCAEYGIAMIGPNCLGVINTDPKVLLNASFARRMPDSGRIAFLSQSGALCTAVLDYAREKHIGFSKFVSFGNKAGVSEIDLLEYLYRDDQTDVILLYLEEISDGRALVDAAKKITRGPGAKPIIAIKSGRTDAGAHAAASHTGSLAGEDAVADAALREAGIVRVTTIEEMFNAAIMYTYQPMPAGDRVAIVTNAGGPGVMATDAASNMGLSIARFEADTTAKLKEALPAAANVKNPVDVIGDARAERYVAALDAVLHDPNVDQVLVILTPQSMTDIETIAEGIRTVHEDATKPIACSFMGATDVGPGIQIIERANIPHYTLPEWAGRAMADVQRIRTWRQQPDENVQPLEVDREAAAAVIDAAPAGYLREDQALDVLKAYGLPVPDHQFCTSVDQAVAAADRFGYPAVLRVVSEQIVHKFEAKGVALNLADAAAVRTAYEDMHAHIAKALPDAEITGVVVRPMIPQGHEVIIGAERDPSFGPILMFGLGGIYVEIFKDVTFALAPIDHAGAARTIRRVKAYSLLEGARGKDPADIAGIEQCLMRVGQLISDFGRIAELDINPLFVGPRQVGNMVADVRIRIDT